MWAIFELRDYWMWASYYERIKFSLNKKIKISNCWVNLLWKLTLILENIYKLNFPFISSMRSSKFSHESCLDTLQFMTNVPFGLKTWWRHGEGLSPHKKLKFSSTKLKKYENLKFDLVFEKEKCLEKLLTNSRNPRRAFNANGKFFCTSEFFTIDDKSI